MITTKTPLYILVDETSWNSIGAPTYRNQVKTNILTRLGGVSNTVAPGTYVFDVRLTLRGFVATLLPAV